MSIPIPSPTPNVIVSNPVVRKWAGNILGVASLLLTIAFLVDNAIAAINIEAYTGPAAVIVGGLFGIFQLTVTSPNVPTKAPAQDVAVIAVPSQEKPTQ
jgi:uncharacterized membrane protein HdeD (DUF308 family)